MPRAAAVSVVVDLGGAWVEDHAVQGYAPSRHHAGGGTRLRLRIGRDFEAILLLGDGVGVTAVGELGNLVVRNTIGLDDPLVPLNGDGDLVGGRRFVVGLDEGRASRLDFGGFSFGAVAGGTAEQQAEREGAEGVHREELEVNYTRCGLKRRLSQILGLDGCVLSIKQSFSQ